MNCAGNPKLLRAPDQWQIGDNNRLLRFELHRTSSVSQEKKKVVSPFKWAVWLQGRLIKIYQGKFYGMFGGLLKSSGGSNKTLLGSRTFNRVVSYINNTDIRELKANAEQSKEKMPKT